MTHSTTSLVPESFGSRTAYLHVIDISSLDATGQENYDPESEVNVELGDDYAVIVADQEDGSRRFSWDHTSDHLDVKNLSDGADTANNTDVGEVKLVVVGN